MSTDKSDPATEVAVELVTSLEIETAAQPRPAASCVMVNPFCGDMQLYTNIDLKSHKGQVLAVRCLQNSDFTSDDVIGVPITVVMALCHSVEIVDSQSGEVVAAPRTVLVMEDGKTVSFVSNGILQSLRLLSKFYGHGPWCPGIRVVIRQITTRLKRRTFVMELAADESPATKGKG